MAKSFKYQALMVEKNVKQPCPFQNCREQNISAFHFGYSDIGDIRNFVPGHSGGRKIRINDASDPTNCAYCGLSMYKTEDGARDKWLKELPERIRKLLGYTHLLKGQIKENLGVMSIEAGSHFTFFEYEGVELRDHFSVLGTL